MRRASDSAGFTLIEVMAAVVILAVALLSLLRANNQTVLLKAHAQDITTATLLAQERLAGLRVDPDALDEESEGDFGERFPSWRWTMTKEEVEIPFDFAGLAPIETVSSAAPSAEETAPPEPAVSGDEEPATLYKITLTVFWPEGVKESAMTITEYVGRTPEETEAASPGGGLPLPLGAASAPGAGGTP